MVSVDETPLLKSTNHASPPEKGDEDQKRWSAGVAGKILVSTEGRKYLASTIDDNSFLFGKRQSEWPAHVRP
jgi:hypothetical protein